MKPSQNNIAGKVVLITGASSGIGEATARHLASLGAIVSLAARRPEKLAQVVADITADGPRPSPPILPSGRRWKPWLRVP
jgi:NADP-dependent 3-hydroxy acid dehydrogenase YdfG